MGVNVTFKVRTYPRLDREAFEALRFKFHEAFPDPDPHPARFPDLRWEYEDTPTIELAALDRYYGQGYERGHWPDIRKMGDWLVDALPGAEVRYGGDSDDSWYALRPWPEVVKENDELWATVGNEPYLAHFRRHAEG